MEAIDALGAGAALAGQEKPRPEQLVLALQDPDTRVSAARAHAYLPIC